MSDSYFPPTPEPNGGGYSSATSHQRQAPKYPVQMSLETHTNGTAPRGVSPSRSGAPTKVSLSLGHLPSKKEVKAVYPRTPSRVCISVLLCVCVVSEPTC